jgi:hypothetical protein
MKIFISILLITIITTFSKFSFAQVNSYTVSGYVYNFNDILIKDASYFNRLDTIKQRKYENNKRIAEMANNYYKEKDYESALFYAKDISFTEYYHFQNIKCFLKVCSNARLGKKWETINQCAVTIKNKTCMLRTIRINSKTKAHQKLMEFE